MIAVATEYLSRWILFFIMVLKLNGLFLSVSGFFVNLSGLLFNVPLVDTRLIRILLSVLLRLAWYRLLGLRAVF